MDLYGEIILDHFKNPHHYGRLEHATLSGRDSNPLCGDQIQLDLQTDNEGTIIDVGFTGQGCAISQAGASMLTDELIGKTLYEAVQMQNEDIYEMLKVPLSGARVKCALLALVTLKKTITLDILRQP
jgi:nitrogen fixation NifU-like protein